MESHLRVSQRLLKAKGTSVKAKDTSVKAKGGTATPKSQKPNYRAVVKGGSAQDPIGGGDPCAWLLQRYVARPMLLHGRKFDLRLYLLVIMEEEAAPAEEEEWPTDSPLHRPPASPRHAPRPPLAGGGAGAAGERRAAGGQAAMGRVYLCSRGLARLCARKYEAPTAENCGERRMHLTNYAVCDE